MVSLSPENPEHQATCRDYDFMLGFDDVCLSVISELSSRDSNLFPSSCRFMGKEQLRRRSFA